MEIARAFGISTLALNAYQVEKNMIGKSLERITAFKSNQNYYERELKEREEKAENYLKVLPEQMSEMFDHLDNLVNEQEDQFYSEISTMVTQ